MNNNYFVRKNPRLKDYDYSLNGYYFITICTINKKHLFGHIIDSKMKLNSIGKQAYISLKNIPKIYVTIKIDKFVIMPNHIHIIIIIKKKQKFQCKEL